MYNFRRCLFKAEFEYIKNERNCEMVVQSDEIESDIFVMGENPQ